MSATTAPLPVGEDPIVRELPDELWADFLMDRNRLDLLLASGGR